MKTTRLHPCLAAAAGILAALPLASCETTGAAGSFTVGYTGKSSTGGEYVIGLNIPLRLRQPDPAPSPEPPLPTDPAAAAAGKSPILPAP